MRYKWITSQLADEVRVLYEPRMGKKLSDDEVFEIANNLASFIEHLLKFSYKQDESRVVTHGPRSIN